MRYWILPPTAMLLHQTRWIARSGTRFIQAWYKQANTTQRMKISRSENCCILGKCIASLPHIAQVMSPYLILPRLLCATFLFVTLWSIVSQHRSLKLWFSKLRTNLFVAYKEFNLRNFLQLCNCHLKGFPEDRWQPKMSKILSTVTFGKIGLKDWASMDPAGHLYRQTESCK